MNYVLSLLIAVVVNMILGMLWYGPLFGKQWMRSMGYSDKDAKKMRAEFKKSGKSMGPTYAVTAVSVLVMAVVLSAVISWYPAPNLGSALLIGFLLWLGLIVPSSLSSVLFENRSKASYMIVMGYYLVSLLLLSAILYAGQPAGLKFY